MPEGVTHIGDSAFAYSGLTAITLPRSLKTIGFNAFSSCSKLDTIAVPSGVTFSRVGRGNCGLSVPGVSLLQGHAVIPFGVTSIPDEAFNYCVGLKTVSIPSGVRVSWLERP